MQTDTYIVAAVMALALVGVAVGATGGPVASQATQAKATQANVTQANVTATVQLDDQTTNGSVVTVADASLPDGGYVAIYSGNGTFLGVSSYVDENETATNVTVNLSTELPDGTTTVVAIAHRDTDADRIFSYVLTQGSNDVPYVTNRIVMDTAQVSVEVEDEVPETPGEETPTPEEETPEEVTPTPEEETPGEVTPTPEEETPEEVTPTPEEETPGEETPAEGEETPAEGEETPAPGEETPTPGE